MNKPASKTKFRSAAHFNNFCFYLGINHIPTNKVSAANTGRIMIARWTQSPRGLSNLDKSRSSAVSALINLPLGCEEYELAQIMVNAMVTSCPLDSNAKLVDFVMNLRTNLARTPEDHLTMVCNDLGIDRPADRQHAKRMAARVVGNLTCPLHRARVVQRVNWIHASLKSLPKGSAERQLAETIISGITQHHSRMPIKIRSNNDCLEAAANLQQILMR